MKVLFCDPLNTQNCSYVCAKHLRQKGVDAHVAMGPDSIVPREHLPSWHDKDTELDTTEWVHHLLLPYFVPYHNPVKYLIRQKRIIDFAKGFDLIVCSGFAPMWMRWTNRPFIFSSYGSDLDQLAVLGWSGVQVKPANLEQRIVHFLVRRHLTGSLRKARATIIMPHQAETAKSVGLHNLHFLPHIIDTQLFKPMDDQQRQQAKQEAHNGFECDLILFHPPRQTWVDRSTADCKGNDKVFRAFAEFIRAYKGRAKLLIAIKGWDIEASKNLVQELEISKHVVWLAPVPRAEMCRLYNAVDVVLDQFVVGVIASVAIEALSCGTPVITYAAPTVKELLYPELPPIINAHDEDEILEGMRLLSENGDLRNDLGRKGREWVETHCGPDVTSTRYIALFQQVKGDRG